jgi:membrane fusion protein, heavy metal efflux system
MTTTSERFLLPALASLLLAGCGEQAPDEHGHEHAGEGADHAHGPADSSLIYTDYTEVTELFVEFPALVAGEPSTFAAHVTRLADYVPLTSGRLDVLLEKDGRTAARFRVNAPARTGIFTPAVIPRDTGQFSLAIEVSDGTLQARHELGTVTVFADQASVEVDQPEIPGDIGYLKEQQWTNPFATTVATERPLRPSVPGFATVLAPADAGAEIRAPADGYFAAAELVRAGSSVEEGAVLGYLVPRLGEGSDFGSLLVALERARAQLALAERDVERLEGLYAEGAIPERRLSEARHAADVARAELSAARARVEQYQRGNREAGIALRAPVAGEVLEVNARPGAFVRAGDRVFRIAAPGRRWLEVRVPERFADGLQQASGAWFGRDGRGTVVLDDASGARVVQIGAAIDPESRTASVTVEYPTEVGPAAVGSRFAAHVFTATPQPLLAIPRSAVIDDGGVDVVFVQTGGEAFVRRPVQLGIYDGELAEVRSGVSAGERVVSRGAYYVKLAASGGEEIGHGHAH